MLRVCLPNILICIRRGRMRFGILLLSCMLFQPMHCFASETEEQNEMIDQNIVWDLFSLEKATNQILAECNPSAEKGTPFPARQIFALLMEGQLEEIYTLLRQYAGSLFQKQWGGLKKMMVGVMLIGVCSGAGVLLGEIYPNGNLGKTVRYVPKGLEHFPENPH